jgi:hypothetical protein
MWPARLVGEVAAGGMGRRLRVIASGDEKRAEDQETGEGDGENAIAHGLLLEWCLEPMVNRVWR